MRRKSTWFAKICIKSFARLDELTTGKIYFVEKIKTFLREAKNDYDRGLKEGSVEFSDITNQAKKRATSKGTILHLHIEQFLDLLPATVLHFPEHENTFVASKPNTSSCSLIQALSF